MNPITGICSKATQGVLAELAADYRAATGRAVAIESVGGVDAARRVQAGEAFDVVVLAADALEALARAGHVRADGVVPVARSAVVVAVAAGARAPDISTGEALRDAVRQARAVGISTGPSGVRLVTLFERWGLADELRARLVTAPPGVPVAALLARGDVELGFQQRPELMYAEGVRVIGELPDEVDIVTTFSAGVAAASARPQDAADFLRYLASGDAAHAKHRHGMEPA
jgi:molybdate transport system substrate-binding protein